MNWFGKILNLPKEFLNESEGPGGGVLQVGINLLKPRGYFIVLFEFFENVNIIFSTVTRQFISVNEYDKFQKKEKQSIGRWKLKIKDNRAS